MLKKEVTYKDYFGNERKKTLYFDLTKSEILKMSFSVNGGLENVLTSILEAEDMPSIISRFEEILLTSYGEKSEDGERFMKGPDISRKFKESPVYDQLFLELLSDEKKAADFVNAVFPSDLDNWVNKIIANREKNANQTVSDHE